MALVFDQWPYLQDGWLTWSAKNGSTSAVPAGTPIGEWEMWDSTDITRTVIPRETVAAKEAIHPGEIGWAQVWVQVAPEPGFNGEGKLVIQLGTDIADVAYDWTSLSARSSWSVKPRPASGREQ